MFESGQMAIVVYIHPTRPQPSAPSRPHGDGGAGWRLVQYIVKTHLTSSFHTSCRLAIHITRALPRNCKHALLNTTGRGEYRRWFPGHEGQTTLPRYSYDTASRLAWGRTYDILQLTLNDFGVTDSNMGRHDGQRDFSLDQDGMTEEDVHARHSMQTGGDVA